MKNKTLMILTLSLMLAGALFAQDRWEGTYWGDMAGIWKGEIYVDQDPIRFEGVWVNEETGEEGALFAKGEIDSGFYVFDEGDILSADGEVIGHWSGKFPIWNDAYVTGPWWLLDGREGKWGGYRP